MTIKELIEAFQDAECDFNIEVEIDTGDEEGLPIKGIGGVGANGKFYLMTYE